MADDVTTRRTALLLMVGASGGAAVGLSAIASARVVAAPATAAADSGKWVPIGKLADFPEGTPRRVTIVADEKDGFSVTKRQPLGVAYVVRKGESITAFSGTCPHLGCLVDAGSTGFHCPCHDSSFTLDGARAAGKPNASLRGLDGLATRLVDPDKTIEVEWRRFMLGTASKESLG